MPAGMKGRAAPWHAWPARAPGAIAPCAAAAVAGQFYAPRRGGGGTPRHARAAAARHNAGRARPCHNGRRAAAAWASPAGTPQVRPLARRAAREPALPCAGRRGPHCLRQARRRGGNARGELETGTRATHARAKGRTAPRRRPARMPAALRGGLAPAPQCPAAMAGGGGCPSPSPATPPPLFARPRLCMAPFWRRAFSWPRPHLRHVWPPATPRRLFPSPFFAETAAAHPPHLRQVAPPATPGRLSFHLFARPRPL